MFKRWLPARERKTDTKLATKRSDDNKESDEVANCRKGIFLYRCQDETVPVKTKTTTRIYCYRTRNAQLYSDESVGFIFAFYLLPIHARTVQLLFLFWVFFQKGKSTQRFINKTLKTYKTLIFFWRYIKNRTTPLNTVHFHGAGLMLTVACCKPNLHIFHNMSN